MIPSSIRWRLPLSYAGIALFAALALGGVLLTILQDYYANMEQDYLERNADMMGHSITQMYDDGIPVETIASALGNFGLISRTRTRFLDADHVVLGDSQTADTIGLSFMVVENLNQDVSVLSTGRSGQDVISVIRAVPPDANVTYERAFIWQQENTQTTVPAPVTSYAGTTSPPDADYTVIVEPRPFYPMPMIDNLVKHGGERRGEQADSSIRSGESITHTLVANDGSLIGYIELSEGPAYGHAIIQSVTSALIGAGAVAVLLAALAGWFISLNISRPVLALKEVTGRMAKGELSARVNLNRWDEFGSLAQSFNEMAHQVEDTVKTLKQFVADAAHEIHTPITALQTNLELAAAEAGTGSNPTAVEFIHQASVQLTRLKTLTDSLLELARLEAPHQPPQYEAVNLNSLISQVHELHASRAEQAGIALDVALPDTPLIINGNTHLLMRVLNNIVDNALKFTPENGTVALTTHQQGHNTEICIQDTGIGIPPDDLPRLFQRFHRARNASQYPGNGLGLVIIKTIVEQHGGSVNIESTGQGTLFKVQLPYIPPI